MLLSGRQHWMLAKLLRRKASRTIDCEQRRRLRVRSRTHAALALLVWGAGRFAIRRRWRREVDFRQPSAKDDL